METFQFSSTEKDTKADLKAPERAEIANRPKSDNWENSDSENSSPVKGKYYYNFSDQLCSELGRKSEID